MVDTVQILTAITSAQEDSISNLEFLVSHELFSKQNDFSNFMWDIINSLGAQLIIICPSYYFIFQYNGKYFVILLKYDNAANGYIIKLSSHTDIESLKDIANIEDDCVDIEGNDDDY